VVVPTYDRWEMLGRALDGVLAQTGVELEVLVVDDASPTPAPALQALEDRRVRVLRPERNLGVASARNAGIEASEGRWVAFLDDDDLWAPDKLARQLAAAEGEGAVFSYGAAVALDERLRPIALEAAPPADELAGRLRSHNAVPGGGSMVIARADVLRKLGGYDPGVRLVEDWDLWVRLTQIGPPAVVDDVLVGYVRHARNTSARNAADIRYGIRQLERKHATFGLHADQQLYSRWIAGGQRRAGHRAAAARTYLAEARRSRSPGDLVRAAGVVLGEGAMDTVARAVGRREPVARPPWLARYGKD
jgi:glycosyltransferase involved in cell wall biosynthesis